MTHQDLFTLTALALLVASCDNESNLKGTEKEIEAVLALSEEAPPLKKECFFETGSWDPMCDPTLMQGINGFFTTVDSAIKKVKRFHPHAENVKLEVVINLEGVADGQGWSTYGEHAAWMDRVLLQLATKHRYPDKPTSLNMKLACTRMLILYDIIAPFISQYADDIRSLGTLQVYWSCRETMVIGQEYRTAKLEANLRIVVPSQDYEMTSQSIKETGFTIRTGAQ